jgi:hypothetical protein
VDVTSLEELRRHLNAAPEVPDKRPHLTLLPFLIISGRPRPNLEGHPQADARLQGIEDLITAGVDRRSIGVLDDAVWKKVIDRIRLSLGGTAVPMPDVALTMTHAEADALPDKDWKDIESQLGVAKAQGLAMYGDKRNDWTPFGGADTIEELLERLERRINAQIKGPAPRYYWEFPTEAFWTNPEVAADFAARLSSPQAPSLLVIDPLRIRNRDVLERLYFFQDSIARNHIAILVLAPFVMPSPSQMLRKGSWPTPGLTFRRSFNRRSRRRPLSRRTVLFIRATRTSCCD